VLQALQRHPEAGALWDLHIINILADLDIVYTTHKRSIFRGKIDGKIALLCRQVNDLAVACSDPSVAQGLIDSIGKIVDLKSQALTQRREYVQVSCQSYIARMLKAQGWYKPSSTEKSDSKPIESFTASTAEELSTSVGSDDGSTEHRTLEKSIGFSYRKVLGALRTRTWLDVWTLATQSPSLHVIPLLPIGVISSPSSAKLAY
jgi:hypothetical protein